MTIFKINIFVNFLYKALKGNRIYHKQKLLTYSKLQSRSLKSVGSGIIVVLKKYISRFSNYTYQFSIVSVLAIQNGSENTSVQTSSL